jgi:hypothetical protein
MYNITFLFFSVKECKAHLQRFKVMTPSAVSVAQALGAMTKTPQGIYNHIDIETLKDEKQSGQDGLEYPYSWKADVFAQTIREIVSIVGL